MRRLFAIIAILILFVAAYCTYPFLTLWRIDAALKNGDQLALDALVDWGRVHESLRQDALNSVMLDSLKNRDAGDNKLATIGGMLGTALGASVIEKMIDGLVNGKDGD
jgi:hypothetical protein